MLISYKQQEKLLVCELVSKLEDLYHMFSNGQKKLMYVPAKLSLDTHGVYRLKVCLLDSKTYFRMQEVRVFVEPLYVQVYKKDKRRFLHSLVQQVRENLKSPITLSVEKRTL